MLVSESKSLDDALRNIISARSDFENQDYEGSINKIDTALERYLKFLCEKYGATEETKNQKEEDFNRWDIRDYLSYLEKNIAFNEEYKEFRYVKDVFHKIRTYRNDVKHKGVKPDHKLVERALNVVEYVIRYEIRKITKEKNDKSTDIKSDVLCEGGSFKLPKLRKKIVPRNSLEMWRKRGWYESRKIGRNVEIARRPYEKWELFEIKIRYLFELLGFEDRIEDIENFNYKDLGPQVDACGGSDGIFFIVECTSRKDPRGGQILDKVRKFASEKEKITKKIEERYPYKYYKKVFVLCVEGNEISESDKEKAEKDYEVKLISSDQVNEWFKYYQVLGKSLKYHIIKGLTGFSPLIIDDSYDPFFHYPAFQYKHGEKVAYHLLIEPDNLIKLAYVYRLNMIDPKGYQRDLKRKKILAINDFLSNSNNYFPNNLIICFDSLLNKVVNKDEWLDFKPSSTVDKKSNNLTYGILSIPKLYCSAEVIDGQHRLYGYLDSSDDQRYRDYLERRRKTDMLGVVAILDPNENDRPLLFVDINSNQTKVDPRHLWALMGRIRPYSLMGFIAQLVEALNAQGVFKNKIHIPGVNTSKGKKLNIANLGKGLLDRKLLHKEENWNLYEGDRKSNEYREEDFAAPLKKLESFFRPFAKDKLLSAFVFTNNGVNVMLRILVEKLKFEAKHRKRMSSDELKQY
ncbi:MAG: DGQHR domain-containing protein, partial [Thermoproteota archaeon]